MKYIEIESLITKAKTRQLECLRLYDKYPDDFFLGKADAFREMAVILEAVKRRTPEDNINIVL